jgi:hypothetical protein
MSTNLELLEHHQVNPDCDCTKCFIKDMMNKLDCTYEQMISHLMELQEMGVLEILDYDSDGFPTKIKRTMGHKQLKKLIGE